MLARVLSWFRPRRAPVVPRDPVAVAPVVSRPTPQTIMDVLREQVEIGPEIPTALPDGVAQLAETVFARAYDAPAPPSFPSVATRVLALARDPDADINQIVGAVQRDAAIASALLRIANSTFFAGGEPATSLRAAVQKIGILQVVEIVLGHAGRSYYQLASPEEIALFPNVWSTLADEGMANGFTAGRLALDLPGSRGERALIGGLLSEIGRPIALRVLGAMVLEGAPHYDDETVLATLDEISPAVGARAISRMNLPGDVASACASEGELDIDARIAQLVAAIAAMQRRGCRVWRNANHVNTHAEQLKLQPLVVRAQFAQRLAYVDQARRMFAV